MHHAKAQMTLQVEDVKAREVMDRLRERMPGYRQRDSQVAMVDAVARTLRAAGASQTPPVLVVEGPCGVGKSVGYSIGAIPVALDLQCKVVIATGTVALQEQLVSKDLPELLKDGGLSFTFCLVKGRGRYACLAKLSALTGYGEAQSSLLWSQDSTAPMLKEKAEPDTLMRMRQLLERGKWNGERDSFPRKVDDQEWRKVTTDRAGCLSSGCRFYNECSFYRARAEVQKADVLVANHDLLLSDAALGGGSILPDPAKTILIIDECHGITQKALSHFATSAVVSGDNGWLMEAAKRLAAVARMCPDKKSINEAVEIYETAAQEMVATMGQMYMLLEVLPELQDLRGKPIEGHQSYASASYRFAGGIVPDDVRQLAEHIYVASEDCVGAVGRISTGLSEAISANLISPLEAEKVIGFVGDLANRVGRLQEAFGEFSRADAPKAPPTARWVEGKLHKSGRIDFIVETSPIAAARQLEDKIWNRYYASIACSATVRTMGDFERFKRRAGLAWREGVECLALPSPFDYASNARLVVPWMDSMPTNSQAFTNEIIRKLPELIDPAVGTLVLFCSKWQMERVYDAMPTKLRDIILAQGSMDRERMLKLHGKSIQEGKGSVLFGMSSFAEGLDLKGKACEHVIVTKLPFKVPDSPVEAATIEWLEKMGRNPFMELSVPDACLKLIQAVGRLLRTETDYGEVTLMDRRVVTARYGKAMLVALPPFVIDIEQQPRLAAARAA